MIYKKWLCDWLKNFVFPISKIQTYKKYESLINIYIIPSLGELNLEEINALKLQNFIFELNNRGLASNTINGIISILKQSIKKANIFGISNINSIDLITRQKLKEKQIQIFNKNEQRKIEEYIFKLKNNKFFGIIFCFYTGLRIGELLALTWKDIDFGKKVIEINKSCYDSWENGKYVKVLQTPKTQNSKRTIPLPQNLISKLKEIKKQSKLTRRVKTDQN